MGFFFNAARETASKPKKTSARGVIPITTLRKMGCTVCSLDKKEGELRSPKMRPSGAKRPGVYLLGGAPKLEDDDTDLQWSDEGGRELIRLFGRGFFEDEVRSNYIIQCYGEFGVAEIECCRGRVEADIEASLPRLLVTVGDEALKWVLANDKGNSALQYRGTMFVAKIGTWEGWVYPIIWPTYVHKKKGGRTSPHQLQLQHDIRTIKELVWDGVPEAPRVVTEGYFDGIEMITGQEPGDLNKLREALEDLAFVPNLAVDIEATGLRVRRKPKNWPVSAISVMAVGNRERTVAFAMDHPDGWPTDRARSQVRAMVGDWLLNSGPKIAHNLAMELEWFEYFYGEDVLRRAQWRDTLLMAYTLDERSGIKSLNFQVRQYFGFWLKPLSVGVDVKDMMHADLRKSLRYCGGDVKWTSALYPVLDRQISRVPRLAAKLDQKIRLAPVLVMAEAHGLPFSQAVADKMLDKYEGLLEVVSKKIARCPEVVRYERQFGTFEPNNSDHAFKLMDVVCKRSEVRTTNRDGTERKTTDEEALSSIPAEEVPSAPLILELRGVMKLLGTYIRPSADGSLIDIDGMLRTKYSQTTAVTDRLASEDTNLQNWPKRKFAEVRQIVEAFRGRIMLACDYGQIEFRVIGMASEDPAIVDACWTDYDVHKFWAERIVDLYPKAKDWIVREFKVDWEEKGLKTLRQETKNKWVFPQLFGANPKSCAEQLHLPEHVTEDLAAEFWDTFSKTKVWQKRLLESYERNLYVETLGGHRRHGAMSLNEVINLPIQGSAAEIVKEGMIAVSEMAYSLQAPDLHPVLNVHDDLTFHPMVQNLEHYMPLIAREMCKPRFDWVNVPLVVEMMTGPNWHELKEVAKYNGKNLFNLRRP